ncbi:MAG: SIMPL domain-containing protein [Henriciella sp.]|nr:SIMPL domain-containing protein [Henriciella sp.]
MTLMMRSRPRTLVATFAVFGLAACGQTAVEDPAPAGPAPENAAPEPAAILPTVVPNAPPLESGHPNSIQPETTLSISATGEVKREPDIAFVSAGVTTEAETASEAMRANASAMNGVFEALDAANVARRDMQTSNFSLQPRYDYSNRPSGSSSSRLVGYTASNQLTVRVRDLDALGETMDALVEAGGNTFSGLRFALEDDRAAKDEARGLAMRDAIARAELYAAASGYEVARIVTISESGGYDPQPRMMKAARSEMASSTPVASGEVGYSVTVNVVFELRQ